MKFDDNLKVEYKSEKLLIPSIKRYLLYRIVPSQLPFWKRLFFNKWHFVYYDIYHFDTSPTCIDDLLCRLFTHERAIDFVQKYKTFGELTSFLDDIYEQAKTHYIEVTGGNWDF